MKSQGDLDDDEFFSQPPSFPLAAFPSGGRGAGRRHVPGGLEGLDLNSEAMDFNDNMSYLDLLRSSPARLVGDGDLLGGARHGAGRAPGRGVGRGRASSRATGRSGSCGRRAAEQDVGIPSRSAGGGRGHARATPNRRPTTTASRQFLPPRPAGGQSSGATPSGADDAFDVGLQNPSTSTWSLNPSNEEADDLQDIDASV